MPAEAGTPSSCVLGCVPLEQFAGVGAALAEGLPLADVLDQERIDPAKWPAAERAWREEIAESPDLQIEYIQKRRVAEDCLARTADPLDSDPGAWLGLFGALATGDSEAILSTLGITMIDVARLGRAWRRKTQVDPDLAKRFEELAPDATPPARVKLGPVVLRPFPWTPTPNDDVPQPTEADAPEHVSESGDSLPVAAPKRYLASFQLAEQAPPAPAPPVIPAARVAPVLQTASVPTAHIPPVASFDPDVTLDPRPAKGRVLPFDPAPAGAVAPPPNLPPFDSDLEAGRPETVMTEDLDWQKLAHSVTPFEGNTGSSVASFESTGASALAASVALPEPPAAVVRSAWTPTFQPEPVVSFDPDMTLDPRPAKGPVLPFEPAPAAAVAPPPNMDPPSEFGLEEDRPETVMTEELDWQKLAQLATPFEPNSTAQPPAVGAFDPDRTLDPRPSHGPDIPFKRGAPVVTPPAVPIPPAVSPSVPGVDETLMVRSPLIVQKPEPKAALGERLTPAAIPELSLDAYAALQAELRAFGDRDEVWRAAGIITEDAKRAVQSRFYDLFRSDSAAQAEFQTSLRGHLARLNAGRGPRGA